MLTPFRRNDLGHFENDWLRTRYHFSFADYHNPKRMGFGTLRVINDDIVRAGSGFDMHPHRDMEIITYVRQGTLLHHDSLGHEGRIGAGDLQVMSAGRGIFHSEHSDPEEDTTLFQIWIRPRERGLTPRWDQRRFPKEPVSEKLTLLVSGRAADADKDVLKIQQDAALYGGRLAKGTDLTHRLNGPAYIVLSEGLAEINGLTLEAGDGAEITNETQIAIRAGADVELLVIEVDAA